MQNFEAHYLPNKPHSTNSTATSSKRFVYVNQHLVHPEQVPSKVLINPHFGKRVYVNPNFQGKIPNSKANIYINPKVSSNMKIHINPNVLRNIPVDIQQSLQLNIDTTKRENPAAHIDNISSIHQIKPHVTDSVKHRKMLYSSRTKLIRSSVKSIDSPKTVPNKRRLSIRSQYKIVKPSLLDKRSRETERENKSVLNGSVIYMQSKHKMIKVKAGYIKAKYNNKLTKPPNKFKLDNRGTIQKPVSPKAKKFIYINKFTTAIELARVIPSKRSKHLSLITINGILYKKSPNSLLRASQLSKKIGKSPTKTYGRSGSSKYKFIKRQSSNKSSSSLPSKHESGIGSKKIKRSLNKPKDKSIQKLKKCNIPCPYYRKYGRCKGKDSGKCFRKHDPDQIALCTKFLQGACVNERCLLSHNVTPEKMPTCKFYLEGICSKDNCPYVHVRLSPKADICRDFLEGFCRMGIKCGKRHQFLCPDYEKNAKCPKQRCPYPHGRMVRKYATLDKNAFAKKSSKISHSTVKEVEGASQIAQSSDDKVSEANVKARYFVDPKTDGNEIKSEIGNDTEINHTEFRHRPKLGELPSYIAFEES